MPDLSQFANCNEQTRSGAKRPAQTRQRGMLLRHDLMNHISFDIGEAKIASRITVCQTSVIQPQQVQNRGVKIVHMDWVFRNPMTVLIAGTIRRTAADSASGQPRRKHVWVMRAALDILRPRGASKLGGANN